MKDTKLKVLLDEYEAKKNKIEDEYKEYRRNEESAKGIFDLDYWKAQRIVELEGWLIMSLKEMLETPVSTRKKYCVVRSYGSGSYAKSKELVEAFNNGWQFVRASEYAPDRGDKVGYIEYILEKEVDNEKENTNS